MSQSVSRHLTNFLASHGVRSVFGVPGAYSIDFVHTLSSEPGISYILASHEGGAVFMAQGYAEASRHSFGCAVTTEGPAALNTVNALSCARADGDSVLLVHGAIPLSKSGRGALQDPAAYGCDLNKLLSEVCLSQHEVDTVADFPPAMAALQASLGQPRGKRGPVHLCVRMDAFPGNTKVGAPKVEVADQDNASSTAASQVREAVTGRNILLSIGHGIYQADAQDELDQLLRLTSWPALTTARGVACVDHRLPNVLGQYSIFPHERSKAWLEAYGGASTDVLLVLGASCGEFGTNSWAKGLSTVDTVVHIDHDPTVFGRLGVQNRVDVECDLKAFLQKFVDELSRSPSDCAEHQALSNHRLQRFAARGPPGLMSRMEEVEVGDTAAAGTNQRPNSLTGQRLVWDLSQALTALYGDSDATVNIVSDTGSAKLYAAHYIEYQRGWRSFMPSGSSDTMGYALPASIGVALSCRDSGDTTSPTVCIVGDGSLFMQNELNTLSANRVLEDLPLIVLVLNDSALSYVYQGFAAVMEEPLEEMRFASPVDIAAIAAAHGLDHCTVREAGELSPELLGELLERGRPVVVDCRVCDDVVGPGYERYNAVRSMVGKDRLSVRSMNELISPTRRRTRRGQQHQHQHQRGYSVSRECFGGGGSNRMHLYGRIKDVFASHIYPEQVTAESNGVAPALEMGLGVSSLDVDTNDVGDAVILGGNFLCRNTDAGLERKLLANGDESLFDVGTAAQYRTSYSLGITSLADIKDQRFVWSSSCHGSTTMREMIDSFVGPPRQAGDPNRIVGFVGLLEYADFAGTSLKVAPTKGDNILTMIGEYARPAGPYGRKSGMCVGFARTNCTEGDSPAAHRLAERMFYHNPKDNSGAGGGGGQLDSGDGGAHWISHTHGALLAPGESVFTGYSKDDDDAAEAIMHQLAHDNLFRNDFINQQCNSTFADCGHVIPNSSLERYFFSVFDIHHVDVFNPSE